MSVQIGRNLGEMRYDIDAVSFRFRAQNNNKQRGKKMKVKVKGLVFVGFAAAVFATSAMAADGDGKIVTSKLYVDSKFQTLDNLTTSSETADWTSDTEYPSMKVVATKVGTLDSVAGIQGDSTYTKVTDVTVGSGSSAHTVKQVELQQTPASASTEITGTLDGTTEKKLVTTKAVKALMDTTAITSSSTDTKVTTPKRVYTYVQDRIKTTSEDTIGSTTGKVNDADVPTMKSVYNFVTSTVGEYQPQAPTTDGTSLYLGHNTATTSNGTTTNTADWKKLEAAATGAQYSSTDYVTIKEDSGVYKINIPNDQVGTASGDVTSGSTKLTQGKAVYAYAQPVLATVSADGKVSIGYKASGSNATWGTLQEDARSGATKYVELKHAGSGTYNVNIASGQIADSITTDGSKKLATENAVYDYVSGFGLGGSATNPCGTSAGAGKYCALVSYWDSTNSKVIYEWTEMALGN